MSANNLRGVDVDELLRHRTALQSQAITSLERIVRKQVRQAIQADPAHRQLQQKLSGLNDRIHRNHLRQAKQRTSFEIYVRKAKRSRQNLYVLKNKDQELLGRREHIRHEIEALRQQKQQDVERVAKLIPNDFELAPV